MQIVRTSIIELSRILRIFQIVHTFHLLRIIFRTLIQFICLFFRIPQSKRSRSQAFVSVVSSLFRSIQSVLLAGVRCGVRVFAFFFSS